MADDTIYNYISKIIWMGKLQGQAFWELVKFKYPTHQISFHTISALDTLRFIGSEVVYGEKKYNNLFFACSLIEFIGRKEKRTRCEVVDFLGKDRIQRLYEYADVFHCEPIEKVADEFAEESKITKGDFDNVGACRYRFLIIGISVRYNERLIEDSYEDEKIVDGIWEVYHSWIDAHISDYNTDFYYQPRDYIAACYAEGEYFMRRYRKGDYNGKSLAAMIEYHQKSKRRTALP